jgi:Nucleotidyltransferase domain
MRNSILKWLKSKVLDHPLVCKAYIFGSILQPTVKYRDIDVVIVFRQHNVRIFLNRIKRQFFVTFHKRLHTQIFHQGQSRLIDTFLLRTNKYMEASNGR